ncbi:MAG: hypothetical protein JW787_02815 [Sedimentisphaerales bacterium]|nr:hypothetical protein [Sedimentisphaerales bacterium]
MKKKKARAVTPAGKGLQSESYIKPIPLSTLKLFLGEALLFGDKNHKKFWNFFEVELRQYVGLRDFQNGYCDALDAAGAENLQRPE